MALTCRPFTPDPLLVRHPFLIFLLRCVVIGLGLAAAAGTHPGIAVETNLDLVLVSLCVGVLNAFLRPILILFTLPFVLLTLGLGLVVINALVVLLAGQLVAGFILESFWAALWAAILVSIASMITNWLFRSTKPGSGKSRFTYSATVRGRDGQVRHFSNQGEPEPAVKKIRTRKRKDDDDVIDI